KRVLERAGGVQCQKSGNDPARRKVYVAEQILEIVMSARPARQRDAEILDGVAAHRRPEVTRERLDEKCRIKKPVSQPSESSLPNRHRRQWRWTMCAPPYEAQHHQKENRHAHRLVQVERVHTRTDRLLRDFLHPPSPRKLADPQYRDQPMKGDRRTRVTLAALRNSHRRSRRSGNCASPTARNSGRWCHQQ